MLDLHEVILYLILMSQALVLRYCLVDAYSSKNYYVSEEVDTVVANHRHLLSRLSKNCHDDHLVVDSC